jgi:hypothetical protein
MGKILGYQPWKKDACLNCHAINVPNDTPASTFHREDGVSCEACHGPAKKWLSEHFHATWRLRTAADKESLGMIDLRAPAKRTELCLKCHLGNAAEGKIVTHEMYAAGHPLLPPFEVATFSRNMPQHWRPLHAVPFLKKPHLHNRPKRYEDDQGLTSAVYKLYRFDSAAWEETRLATIGGMTVLRQAVKLFAAQAARQEGIDLASYDCFACHHDLKLPSWRQRLARGGFGRPNLPLWPNALVRLGIRQLAGTDAQQRRRLQQEYAGHENALHEAVCSKPFGGSSQAKAAQDLQHWIAGLLENLEQSKFERQTAEALWNELYELSQEKVLHFDSARQIAWAAKVIHAEVHAKDSPEESTLWMALDKELYLSVPGRKNRLQKDPAEVLRRIHEFDPDLFAGRLRKIRKQLE